MSQDTQQSPELVISAISETPEVPLLQCFYCKLDSGIETEAEYTLEAIVAEVWNTHRYSQEDFERNEVRLEEFRVHNMQNRRGIAERGVCDEHHNTCELCGDLYLQPSQYDNISEIPAEYRPRSYQTTAVVQWNHHDRVCYSCEDSAFVCDRCEDIHHMDDCQRDDGGYLYCEDCASALGIYYCDECDENHSEVCHYASSRLIHDYSYKPDPEFKWVESVDGDLTRRPSRERKVFMGFELEVEANDANRDHGAEEVLSQLGEDYVYLKSDSSINYGFEIVSHPATLAYHKTRQFSVLREIAENYGFSSWQAGTCGIHVHISRTAFDNPSHIWKFTHLIVDNKAQMVKLAGRNSDRWATFEGVRGDIKEKANGSRYVNRYEAVNFQNTHTLELRFFKGSLLPARLFMALELTDAMAEYTRTLTANDVIHGGLQFANFALWVAPQERYSNLTSYLTKFNLLPIQPSELSEEVY